MFLFPHQQRQSPDLPTSPPGVSHQLIVSDRHPAPTKANPPRTIEGNKFPTFTNPYQRPQTLGNFNRSCLFSRTGAFSLGFCDLEREIGSAGWNGWGVGGLMRE